MSVPGDHRLGAGKYYDVHALRHKVAPEAPQFISDNVRAHAGKNNNATTNGSNNTTARATAAEQKE